MKSGFQPLAVIRHSVAIAGRVTDRARQPVANAVVALTDGPPLFCLRIERLARVRGVTWEKASQRPDRTLTAADGSYRFVDLPSGTYQLTANAAGRGLKESSASVEVRVGSAGELQATIVNLELENM